MILNNLHIRVKCASSGIYGDVVLDSIVNNTSSGGVRIAEDLSVEEVATLAREMTLKNSFWGLPKGGARGGIRIPSGICAKERRNILAEFGRRIAPLITTGIYLPWLDMNCGYEDLKAIYDGAGVVLGKPTDTAFCTALTVAEAMIACAEAAGLAERRVTVAIEGFGSVATHLAERLPEERFRIIAVSTSKGAVLHNGGFSPKMLVSSRKEHGGEFVRSIPGSTRIGREELLELEVDILVPSARTWAINDRNAGNVRARFIVPVANVPYTERAVDLLHDRGIVCLPGFVTNAGGVYASSLYDSGVAMEQIEQLSATYYRDIITTLLARSKELARSPVRIAESIAYEQLASRMDASGEAGTQAHFLRRAFRKKLIPRSVYGEFMLRTCVRNLIHLNQRLEGAASR